ncbi:hypothetical protein V1512DRAFT_277775 [Lipomyces arxii]|uniref:uncharacterized protein n=1 Tax=Lipomyces arxii TaxID=56418 RepID=UPI0034CD826A
MGDRAARIASRTRGAGTRRVDAAFSIVLPKAKTPKATPKTVRTPKTIRTTPKPTPKSSRVVTEKTLVGSVRPTPRSVRSTPRQSVRRTPGRQVTSMVQSPVKSIRSTKKSVLSELELEREHVPSDDADQDVNSTQQEQEEPVLSKGKPKQMTTKKRKRTEREQSDGYVEITTHKLPSSIGGEGAPSLTEVDIVSQVLDEQITASAKSQPTLAKRRLIERFALHIRGGYAALRDAVDTHGVLHRQARLSRRKVVDQQDKLMTIRRERQRIADEIAGVREAHAKAQAEARADMAVRDVLRAITGLRSRARPDDTHGRTGVLAEVEMLAPLVCGSTGALGQLREFNDLLERTERELISQAG